MLTSWLEEIISRELEISVDEVRDIRYFDALGVDSLLAAYLTVELSEKIGRPVEMGTVYECGDYRTLAESMGA